MCGCVPLATCLVTEIAYVGYEAPCMFGVYFEFWNKLVLLGRMHSGETIIATACDLARERLAV